MIGAIAHPFPTLVFIGFYLMCILASLIKDSLFRHRALFLSIASGFLAGVGFLWLFSYTGNGWDRFEQVWYAFPRLMESRSSWHWYALQIPNIALWCGLPTYIASVVVRLNRRFGLPNQSVEENVGHASPIPKA